ncbi:hypothetical protein [Histidinibacterium aquaticum]|uniref:Uncharacterized protein n=1 Tax=Histidinibacterium aquaticum TaxID=2613962 RepID=A0A5J5GDI9_9RHOB|nr:hypothetical protein [Histidinibacterium aquaticum]KAA9006097.1 hypothetical protein F3S47_16220 [Histidinibacterium aquaticum]
MALAGEQVPETDGISALTPGDRDLLGRLRMTGMRCRAAARSDLFDTCAALGSDREAGSAAFAEALMRSLDQVPGRRWVLYRPGSRDVSFDERWLLALIDALRRGDEDSATFLIRRRIAHADRRPLGFLAAGLARTLEAA